MPADTPDRILRIRTVLNRTGLSRSTLYRKMDNGTFPPSLKMSERCADWRESAVEEGLKDPIFHNVRERGGQRTGSTAWSSSHS